MNERDDQDKYVHERVCTWAVQQRCGEQQASHMTTYDLYLCSKFIFYVMVFLSVMLHKVFYQVVSFFWRGAIGNSVGRVGLFLEYHTVTGNSCSFFESNI